MPKYFYKCESCQNYISAYHSMSEQLSDCTECGAINSLVKKPSFFTTDDSKEITSKVGDVVKKSISNFKEELEQDKQRLREVVHEPN
tara:strand:- start:337 stop:597 length:261 start_codon:yes stop_codon:yes gene_type:complete